MTAKRSTTLKATGASSEAKTDPVVLGIAVPLQITKTHAGEVASAWRGFATSVITAAREKREASKARGVDAS